MSESPATNLLNRIEIHHLISLTALFILLHQLNSMWPHTVDDAYISLRYAENWVTGGGLTWNYNGAPVEGYSNFLWIVFMASYLSIGLKGIFAAKLTGALAAIAQLPLIYLIGRKVGLSKRASSLSLLLYSTIPAVAFWAVSGLATALFTFLFLSSLYLVSREDGTYDRVLASISFGLFALTRHEGMVIFLAVVGVYFLLKSRSESIKEAGVRASQLLFAGGTIYTSYFMWRLLYYGYILPNTAYLKGGASRSAITHPLQFISYLSPLLFLAVVAYYAHTSKEGTRRLRLAISSVLIISGVLGVMLGAIITPGLIASTLSSDGTLGSSTVTVINNLRILSGAVGALVLFGGLTALLSPRVVGLMNPVPLRDPGSESVALLTIPVFIWIALSMVVSPSMMHGVRFFHPVVPIVSVLCITGVVVCHRASRNQTKKSNSFQALSIILIILLVNPLGIDNIPMQSEFDSDLQGENFNSHIYSYDEFRSFAIGYGALIDNGNVPLGKWMNNNTRRTDYVALGDAGAIPYYCRCNVIDLIGLNSIEAAHGDRSAQDILNKKPKFIILTGSNKNTYQKGGLWGSIYSNEEMQNNYVLLYIVDHSGQKYEEMTNSEYVYWIFVREDANVEQLRSSMESSLRSESLVLPAKNNTQ